MATKSPSEVIIDFPDGSSYSIDATESISITWSQSVTSNAVEEGVAVSDHVSPQPLTINIQGFMSDSPMDAKGYYDPEAPGTHTEVLEKLEKAANSGWLCALDCGPVKGVYEDLIVTSFTPTWTNTDGQSMPFSLSLQQILIASTETVYLATQEKQAFLGGAADGANTLLAEPVEATAFAAGAQQGALDTTATARRYSAMVNNGVQPGFQPSSILDESAWQGIHDGAAAGIQDFVRGQ